MDSNAPANIQSEPQSDDTTTADTLKFLDEIQEDSFEDRAFGSILGAFIADSCGSYIEFQNYVASHEQMIQCMQMPGGGPHRIGPGQITDDSELAMCLMHALCETNLYKEGTTDERLMDTDCIAKWYGNWIRSGPFDIGTTTIGGLRPIAQSKIPLAQIGKQNAHRVNQGSLSNGSLMRCTPLAVWTSTLQDPKEVMKATVADVEMTHPNKIVQSTIFVYISAIHYLLNHPQDSDRALKAFQLAVELSNSDVVNDKETKNSKGRCSDWLLEAAKLSEQADKAESDSNFLNDKYNALHIQGFLKHAFLLSFYLLLRFQAIDQSNSDLVNQFYKKACKEAIQLGGDTDTNGCIVGGMIGALLGIKKVDQQMLQTLLNFDCTTQKIKRPEFLSVKQYAIQNIKTLIKLRPLKTLVIQETDLNQYSNQNQ